MAMHVNVDVDVVVDIQQAEPPVVVVIGQQVEPPPESVVVGLPMKPLPQRQNTIAGKAVQPPPPPKAPVVPRQKYLLYIAAISLALAAGILALLIYMVVEDPFWSGDPEFSMSSASVSSFNLTGVNLSGTLNLSIVAHNNKHNKHTRTYSFVTAELLYSNYVIAKKGFPKIILAKLKESEINVDVTVQHSSIDPAAAVMIASSMTNYSAVSFDVLLMAKAPFLNVSCSDIMFEFNDNTGTMAGPPKRCDVSSED